MQIDDEMERHSELLKEIQDGPTDINAVVARRRKDFTGEFFRYLTLVSESHDSLEDRDGNCLSICDVYIWIGLMAMLDVCFRRVPFWFDFSLCS